MRSSRIKIALNNMFSIKSKQAVSLRRRLMLYLLLLILIGVGLLLLFLFLSGVFNENRNSQMIRLHLNDTLNKLEDRVDFLAGSGLELSKSISKSIENNLEYPYDIRSTTNDREKILELEKAIYPILENYLDVVRVSGAFVILDTTVNDEISALENSRSGLHIHLGNLCSMNSFYKDVFLFRGMSEIVMENHVRMHNRWNMEIGVD